MSYRLIDLWREDRQKVIRILQHQALYGPTFEVRMKADRYLYILMHPRPRTGRRKAQKSASTPGVAEVVS
tara:strand:+ start:198 stop:407 length:210 start_codon:yes stop_codon:yes gene_type:complete